MRSCCLSLAAAFVLCLSLGCGSEPAEVMPEPTLEEEMERTAVEMENEAAMEDPANR